MAEPFLSEIRMFGFGWPPRGWAQCDGQLIPINDNQSLYALIGTTYGGDGRNNFGLPDMRGRAPVKYGGYTGPEGNNNIALGEKYGFENVVLTEPEMARHTHITRGTTSDATSKIFANGIFASAIDNNTSGPTNFYTTPENLVGLNAASVTPNGGGASHSNIQPSLVVNFCIAITGLFPSRN